MRLAGTAATLIMALATTHCSGLESAEDTYCTFHCSSGDPSDAAGSSAAQADDGSASLTNPWWCESDGTAKTIVLPPVYPADAAPPTTVRYYLPIIDFQSLAANNPQPVRNPIIVLCPGNACATSGTTPTLTSTGAYSIDLPFNFAGSILITAPAYMPTQYFFGGPMVGTAMADGAPLLDSDGTPIVIGQAVTPLTTVKLNMLFSGAQIVEEPSTGIFVARLLDCNGNRAAKVGLIVSGPSSGATGFTLFENYEPIASNPPLATDIHGVAGYFNMTPGDYGVSATTPDQKATYGDNGENAVAVIQPGVLTEVEIRTDQHAVGR